MLLVTECSTKACWWMSVVNFSRSSLSARMCRKMEDLSQVISTENQADGFPHESSHKKRLYDVYSKMGIVDTCTSFREVLRNS